jgi:hypothetical protein
MLLVPVARAEVVDVGAAQRTGRRDAAGKFDQGHDRRELARSPLQDSSAQIRVRGAVLLLAGLVLVAQRLGLETILGRSWPGALLRVVDRDEAMTHPRFRAELEALSVLLFP